MPVLLQGSCVVILNSAIERCIDNGVAGFRDFAPNGRAYSDDFLSQCSFMNGEDAEEFQQQLVIRGVVVEDAREMVLIEGANRDQPLACEWLQLFEYKGHLIGRHREDTTTTIIAHEGFDLEKEPEIRHYSAEEIAEKLEFVRREGNIEVYRHKETGEELFVGRTTESIEQVFEQSAATIRKHFRNPGHPPADATAQKEIREAVNELQRVIGKYPEFWQAYFFLGKAWQSLDNYEHAYKNFIRAHKLEEGDSTICKELAGVCLELGNNHEALTFGQRAVAICPDDATLLCNLAVNHLLVGNGEAAQKSIRSAMKLDPDDQVNQNVKRLIDSVTGGQRAWPKSFAELTGRSKATSRISKPQKTWWQKLTGQ